MTLEDLRIFAAVCHAGNLSAVARDLGRTQPAVSQHVTRLEQELGVALLQRGRTGVTPTAAGNVLFRACSAGLAGLAMAVHEIETIRAGSGGEVSIATGGTTVRHFMREAVRLFRETHPAALLRFEPAATSRECVQAVLASRADLAFISHTREYRGIEQRPVLEMPLVLLVPADDPWAHRRRVRLDDLAGGRYVSPPPTGAIATFVQDALRSRGLDFEIAVTVDDFDTANVFVEIGVGRAIVPAVHAREFASGGSVRALRIEGLPPVRVGWAARQFDLLPTSSHDFMDALAASATRWSRIPGVRRIGVRTAKAESRARTRWKGG